MPQSRMKTLALILAGGEGSRLEVLTEKRAKPVMPFAGMYRLIDFALSNCMHSRIDNVWIIEQYQPHSLNEHLANGRPWDLDRTYGGLQVLPPYMGQNNEGGFAEGNADAIYRHKTFIREFNPDILLILSADHVYKLDYSKVIERHLELKADVTMVTTQVPIESASRFGTVKVDKRGRVTDFAYKPKKPQSDIVTTEVFVYDARKLLETLDQIVGRGGNNAEGGEGQNGASLKDFGHELLPQMVRDGKAFEYRMKGYWRDVGTVESYWQSHMDLLLTSEPELLLDDPEWPILTYGAQRMPARIQGSAIIENSLISSGCTIHGQVVRSVLAPGVIIEQDAVVRDSILLHGAVVAARATVDLAVLDADVHVGEAAVIGDYKKRPKGEKASRRTGKDIVLVGQKARVPAGTHVTASSRIKPNVTEEGLSEKSAANTSRVITSHKSKKRSKRAPATR